VSELPQKALDRLVARISERHPACGIAAPLLAIRERDRGAHESLETLLVSGDPRLDERLERLAGVRGAPDVDNVGAALRERGFRRVHAAALVSTTISELAELSTNLDAVRFWRYACAVGTIATIAAVTDDRLTDEAFAGGFFHAIGRLLLDQHAPDAFGRVARLVAGERLPLLEAESAVFGFTEVELASALALHWGFPGWLVEALVDSALPVDDVTRGRRGLTALVMRARLAASTRGWGTEFEPSVPPPPSARWLVEPVLMALDRLGGDDWLEDRVTALLRVSLLESA
jgi:hypothetical protein